MKTLNTNNVLTNFYSRRGFSLNELLVVVAIIVILSSVGAVGYQRYLVSTRIDVAVTNLTEINVVINNDINIFNGDIDVMSELMAGRESLTVFGNDAYMLVFSCYILHNHYYATNMNISISHYLIKPSALTPKTHNSPLICLRHTTINHA